MPTSCSTVAHRESTRLLCAESDLTCPRLAVWTKGDLASPPCARPGDLPPIVTSALTGAGVNQLRSAIAERVCARDADGELPGGTAARCRASLVRAGAALRSAALSLLLGRGDELVAFDLHLAVEELGRIVGTVVTDDILDRIFRRFCIGK